MRAAETNPSTQHLAEEARAYHAADVAACKRIGALGAEALPQKRTVLTHCNAGALATGGYGTALGVIRAAIAAGKHVRVLASETRPLPPGRAAHGVGAHARSHPGRAHHGLDGRVDFMAREEIDAVVVGADRIAENGDVANKIGTYGVACLAARARRPVLRRRAVAHGRPRMRRAARPSRSRSAARTRCSRSATRIAPAGVPARNPAFDVTPARLDPCDLHGARRGTPRSTSRSSNTRIHVVTIDRFAPEAAVAQGPRARRRDVHAPQGDAPRARPPHRLRRGALPERRRVLDRGHRDGDAPRRRRARAAAASAPSRPAIRAAPSTGASPSTSARAIAQLGLQYVVLTMVDRDDLLDGGASHVARTVTRLRELRPDILVETLLGDFGGHLDYVDVTVDAEPDVCAHNIEVVRRLQRTIRDVRCSYEQSLARASPRQGARPGAHHEALDHGRHRRDGRRGPRDDGRSPRGRRRPRHARPVPAPDAEARRGRSLRPPRRPSSGSPPKAERWASRTSRAAPLVRSSYKAAEVFVRSILRPDDPKAVLERRMETAQMHGTTLVPASSLVRKS